MGKITVTDRYEDIMDHPHYQSKKRPHMSLHNRAAQFAPFAALSGYEASIKETERLTQERITLGSDQIDLINEKLQAINAQISGRPRAAITYFVPDAAKAGGSYICAKGPVKKIDGVYGCIIMEDGTVISIKDISDIEFPLD